MIKRALVAAVGLSAVLGGCNRAPRNSTTALPSGPPLGHYSCWAGGYRSLPSGEFTLLPDGTYDDGRSGGEGTFAYDAYRRKVNFTSGDFRDWEFVAVYQDSNESSSGRERLVLQEPQYTAAIGKENPGQFQYCYPAEGAESLASRRVNRQE